MNKLSYRIVLFAMFFSFAAVAQDGLSDDSLYRRASSVVSSLKEFEKEKSGKLVGSYEIPYSAAIRKKTKVTVTTINKTVRELTYISYDESLTTSQKETYYFDPAGKLVCHINRSTGVLSYDVYVYPYLVLFNKDHDPTNNILKGSNAQFHFAAEKYIIDYYLGACGVTGYSTFDISNNNSFQLTALKDLPLRQQASPAASIIQTLPKGTKLYYLDRSASADSVSKVGTWVWYKVRTKSGRTGWIWGYPSGIREQSGE